ncbi:MAG: hypothetical protein QXR44_01575 [Thermoproteota archaeon]
MPRRGRTSISSNETTLKAKLVLIGAKRLKKYDLSFLNSSCEYAYAFLKACLIAFKLG